MKINNIYKDRHNKIDGQINNYEKRQIDIYKDRKIYI